MPSSMKEYGAIGQRRYAGVFSEEFLKALQGKRGIEVYREMSENDDVCGAILYTIEMMIRQTHWSIESGGDSEKDRECAEFVQSCMDDMQDTWIDTISEILSFLTYGWSYHEIVYKRRAGDSRDPKLRSKYADMLIGWQKLPIRAQETLFKWEYDDNDNLIGMTQIAPPSYEMLTIPIEKALLFRTKSRKNNPEGRSIFRSAYRSWYFKRRIQEIEGMGIERDLAGLPIIHPPEGIDIWNADDENMVRMKDAAEGIVRNVRRDATEGLVLPNGWQLELLTSGGRRQFDTSTIINRYDSRIAMTVLADFIMLGHQATGTYALSNDKTNMFTTALGAYLDIICEVFNSQAIPRLIGMNAEHFNGIEDYPKLVHGKVSSPNLKEMGDYIKTMTGSGVIMPDEPLEDYVRKIADLPERLEAQQFDGSRQASGRSNSFESNLDMEDLEREDEADRKAAEEAKKALGRE